MRFGTATRAEYCVMECVVNIFRSKFPFVDVVRVVVEVRSVIVFGFVAYLRADEMSNAME